MAQTIVLDGYMLGKRLSGTGINRYLINLLREFEKITARASGPEFLVLVPSVAECGSNGFAHRQGFRMAAEPLMRFHRAWKYGLVNYLTIRTRSGVLFIPIPVSVYVKPKRLAITVHDIAPLVFPEHYGSPMGRVFMHTYRSSISKADLILTDSAYSRADMISRLGVPAAKIVVAPLGFDSNTFHRGPVEPGEGRELLGRYGVDRPYILHVGRGDPRKNLVRLVQSYEVLNSRRRDLDFQLVLSGSLGWGYQPLLQLLKKPSLQGRVILTGPVPDRELALLYSKAMAFAMPSLYEGFGLPVLEAMACGTPVISSIRTSLPEIGGDAALYFDPESEEEISNAMERIATNSALREQLVMQGLTRAKQFSWEACARITLAALKKL